MYVCCSGICGIGSSSSSRRRRKSWSRSYYSCCCCCCYWWCNYCWQRCNLGDFTLFQVCLRCCSWIECHWSISIRSNKSSNWYGCGTHLRCTFTYLFLFWNLSYFTYLFILRSGWQSCYYCCWCFLCVTFLSTSDLRCCYCCCCYHCGITWCDLRCLQLLLLFRCICHWLWRRNRSVGMKRCQRWRKWRECSRATVICVVITNIMRGSLYRKLHSIKSKIHHR